MTALPPEDGATRSEHKPPMSLPGGGFDSPGVATTTAVPVIAGYQLVRLLGEGGMGAVYEAWQEKPRRRVALKLVRPGLISEALLKRFSLEVEVLGRLEHPAIGRIYAAGSSETNGIRQPYFAMEYIEGVPITQYAEAKNLSTRERVLLLMKVVNGVHHAHQRGVIHRDLKPPNILVTGQGEPKILDFGVARVTDSDVNMTTLPTDIGLLVGTLHYMSPEQATGDAGLIDTRSDIYSLGVIAFEVLTGQRPYNLDKKLIHEAARIIRETEPTKISSLNRTLRGDVETIVGKALEKDKDRRYSSASALAADLDRYLADEPIAARPASAWYQVGKFARRNKVLVGSTAAIALALVAGTVAATLGMLRAQRAEAAEQALRRQAEYDGYVASIAAAADYLDNGELVEAERLLLASPEVYRNWEWHRLHSLLSLDRLTIQTGPVALVDLAVAPDGTYALTADEGGGCRVWDLATGAVRGEIPPHPDGRATAALAGDASLFLRLAGGELVLWEMPAMIPRWQVPVTQTVDKLHLPSGLEQTVLQTRGRFDVRSLADGSLVRTTTYQDPASWQQVRPAPDASFILHCDLFGNHRRSLVTGAYEAGFDTGVRDVIRTVAFAPDGRRVYLAGALGAVFEFDERGALLRSAREHRGAITQFRVLGDGAHAVSVSTDGSARLWDRETLTPVRTFTGHRGGIRAVAGSADGAVVVTYGDDGAMKVWDRDGPQAVVELGRFEHAVNHVALSADGRLAAVAHEDWVHVFDLATREEVWRRDFKRFVCSLDFHPANHDLAVGSFSDTDHRLMIFPAAAPEPAKVLVYPRYGTVIWRYAANGRDLAGWGGWGVRIMEWESEQVVRSVAGPIPAAAWLPDGNRLLAGEATLELLDVESGATIWEGPDNPAWGRLPSDQVGRLSISPDGKLFAHERALGRIGETGPRFLLDGHSGVIRATVFTPDSRRLFTASEDRTIRVWDTETGRTLMALRGHDGEVVSMALSPDGSRLLTGGYDRRVLLWESGLVSSNIVAVPPVAAAARGRAFDAAFRRVVVDAHAGTGLWRNGEEHLVALTSRVAWANQQVTDAVLADQDLVLFAYTSDRVPEHPLVREDVQRLAAFVADGGALWCVGQSWSFAQRQEEDPGAASYPLNTIGHALGFSVLPAYAEPPFTGAVAVARDGDWMPSVLRLPESGDPVVWVRDAQGRPVAGGFDHGRGRVAVVAHEGLLEDNPALAARVFAYLAPLAERLPVAEQAPVRLARLGVAPVIDGVVDPAEYGLREPVAKPGDDNGFGDANHLGDLYAAHDGERLYLGLRGASLDERMTNGIVVFISSPRIADGWRDPALGTDRGEVGDPPGQPVAEALITRGGRGTGGWALPVRDFADLAVAVVDTGSDRIGDGQRPPPRSSAGIYLLGSPCSAHDLGFWPSRYAWTDRGPGGAGGLEAVVDFAFLGNLQPGDLIELVAFIARPDGYTSNETLPGDLLVGSNPGIGLARFRPTTIKLIIGE